MKLTTERTADQLVHFTGKVETLLATRVVNANGTVTGAWVIGLYPFTLGIITLRISAKNLAGGGTANIYVQYSPDGAGAVVDDMVSFTQITNAAMANGSYVVTLNKGGEPNQADRAVTSMTLAANSVNDGPWGDRLRVVVVAAMFGVDDTVTVQVSGNFE